MKKEMDFSGAFGRADREFVYCVHNTLQTIKAQEETKMKKKIGMGVIAIALLLLLAMGTAIALGMHWKHIETAMDLAVESGAYFEWGLDKKIRLIQDMQEDGVALKEDETALLWDPAAAPEEEEQMQKEKEPSDWEKRGQEKLRDMESVYYNPGGGKNYHFIPDCLMVKKELLPLTALSKTDSVFQRLTPCPACVNNHDYWSLEDKILYQCGSWPAPEADWISSVQGVETARKALHDQGFTIDGLYPAVYSQEMDGRAVYQIFFDRLEIDSATGYVLIEPVYTVIMDAKTGDVISARENQSNG